MNVVFWNIGEYGKIPCQLMRTKLRVVRELVRKEKPDILCVIEGTKAEYQNRILKYLMKLEGYSVYYDPTMPKEIGYANYFEFKDYNPFGLKIFYKSALINEIALLQPGGSVFEGRLVKVIIKDSIFIFLHRNRSATNYDQHEFIRQIKYWITFEPDMEKKNFFILGDFNLCFWDDDYYTEQAGYLQASVIYQVHEIRSRENLGLSFYNPIVQVLNSKNSKNLGGTYYDNNKKYKWQILDYILIKKYNPQKIDVDIITDINSYELIDKSEKTKDLIKYGFDHLPIKINLL